MIEDIQAFLSKFGFDQEALTPEQLKFRMSLLAEEYEETEHAFELEDPEEFVDGLIDIIVIAIGTLVLAGVSVQDAWDEVMRANMSKVRGVKKGRENSGGFDVMKPKGWKGPSHEDNHGKLDEILQQDA